MTIHDVPIFPFESKQSSTVPSHDSAGDINGGLGTATKQANNEETQAMKLAYYNEIDWEDKYPSEEPSRKETLSNDDLGDDDFSVPNERDILKG